jgi:hypothetical protein
MATQINKGHVFGLSGVTISLLSAPGVAEIAGYIQPNLQSLRLVDNGDADVIKNQAGEISGYIFSGQHLECTINFIPEGTTIANAKSSAQAPTHGAGMLITGMPVVAIGAFTDAWNTNATNAQPWIYFPSANLDHANDQKLMASYTFRRAIGITSAVNISA